MKLLAFIIAFFAFNLVGHAQDKQTFVISWDLNQSDPISAWRFYERAGNAPNFTWELRGTIPFTAVPGGQKFSILMGPSDTKKVLALTAVSTSGVETPRSLPLEILAAPGGVKVIMVVESKTVTSTTTTISKP